MTVPHRQVVLTIPKRLRAWCLNRRALLGDLARVAAHTVTAVVRTLTREPELSIGCIQTHGSLAKARLASVVGWRKSNAVEVVIIRLR